MALIDIHQFDGSYRNLIPNEYFTQQEKQELFSRLEGKMSQKGFSVVQTIYKDCKLQPNYDNRNNVYADDLLASLCYRMDKNEDWSLVSLLDSQYCDLVDTSGWCPQGRTTRTWQVLHCLL